jgi:clan AA aspartic protease
MGAARVTVTVRNPAKPGNNWEGIFLVDGRAWDSRVPGKILRMLGFRPMGQRTYQVVGGTEVTMKVTTGELEFMGEIVGSTIIFGPDDAEPILGVTALESAGIEVDPQNQRLKRLPAVRLKARRSAEDAEDLAAFEETASEPDLPFEEVVRDMKRRGRI